ncbi:hypothetical protein SEA_ZIPP_42 [Gordonia phage Zipp]|uniref:Uncharacterized protein n=1 Tax=Gordonia phage Zipp TaxID=2591212 RepID=A0A514DHV7_9CAUD|nr:hypothetical protein J1775_gp42 [Gordonia phage Zipp]QDH93196.1 hypothetical protein SEA_ZIPP_42 [Gordonia phage Zipp]
MIAQYVRAGGVPLTTDVGIATAIYAKVNRWCRTRAEIPCVQSMDAGASISRRRSALGTTNDRAKGCRSTYPHRSDTSGRCAVPMDARTSLQLAGGAPATISDMAAPGTGRASVKR